MAKKHIVTLLVRVLLPAGILLSIGLRPFGLSLVYLLLFLIIPLIPTPTSSTINGCPGKFLLINLVVSVLLLLMHVAWHVALAIDGRYGSLLDNYPLIEPIAHNLGLVSYKQITAFDALHYLSPELLMMGTTVLTYVAVKRLVGQPKSGDAPDQPSTHQQYPLLTSAGKFVCLLLVMVCGATRPSVSSGVYYVSFVGAATAWAAGAQLRRSLATLASFLMMFMAVHVSALLVYQCTFLMDLYGPKEPFARYFGMTQLVNLKNEPFTYDSLKEGNLDTFFHPFIILITYFILAIEAKELRKPQVKVSESYKSGALSRRVSFARSSQRVRARDRWLTTHARLRNTYSTGDNYLNTQAPRTSSEQAETDPLIRNHSGTRPEAPRTSSFWSAKSPPVAAPPMRQDSAGSIVLHDSESMVALGAPTLFDEIIVAVVDFFQVLIRSSYIATCITMMAWSIMYHSWLTFVFLMWANVTWLCHNQRSFMLNTSPVLVLYAICLLLIQYVYSMDLTEAELPSSVPVVNLGQIGISRPTGRACVPVVIKSLLTCMFWVTLRQSAQERRQRRREGRPPGAPRTSSLTDMEMQPATDAKSRLLGAAGAWLRAFCARYWIYVVVILLFVIGITGQRMTIFRILYMFLFLVFIILFQMSLYWWRRLMYGFWIVVIIYSMLILILIYVYQFDNFSKLIEKYLFVSESLQHDLGLDRYDPADLFLRLLTPTAFLIVTIMQVHYFHKDFMAISNSRSQSFLHTGGGSSRPSQGASTMKDDLPALGSEEERPASPRSDTTEPDQSLTEARVHVAIISQPQIFEKEPSNSQLVGEQSEIFRDRPSLGFRDYSTMFFNKFKRHVLRAVDKLFVFLDLHIHKITLIALMLLCVLNVCALHVPIMLAIAPACLVSGRRQRALLRLLSVLVSVYLMALMVYQIEYIKHADFDVNCTLAINSTTWKDVVYNNAEWMGFRKASTRQHLAGVARGYIALIALFTLSSLITYRQKSLRYAQSIPKQKEYVMFPEITRKDADTDTVHCIKYLFNYGFYKFGVEITLICLVGVIGSRMDLYAVLYSIWLFILVSIKRPRQARIWSTFTVFSMVLIPFQYLLTVGAIPELCVQYPWAGESDRLVRMRNWLFLPYSDPGPHATKLIFDFFLLLFSARQLRVFRIERTYKDRYEGGSNSFQTGELWETPEFVNPVPDFTGVVTTWLDVIKRLVFLGMLWVTLAILFLTGANRVNLFSIGYLIGSFVFLWQGTDLYLRPKETILNWWSWLMAYNVCVVCVKCVLQVPACMFSTLLQSHACWLVQLLGIGCVDKFQGGSVTAFLKMTTYSKTSTCAVPQEDIGLAWDGACFAFLILQQRLFHTNYFYRVIDECKATTILASRGAELMEQLRQKQMQIQDEQERTILEKIKEKMERIKANQKKIQGQLAKEPIHHDRGDGPSYVIRRREFSKRHEGWRYVPPTSHAKAVRSGDYYMFEEFDDTDVPLQDEESSEDEDAPKEMGIGQLVSTAYKTDLHRAVSLQQASAAMRRGSAPPERMQRASLTELRRRTSRTDTRSGTEIDVILPHRSDRDDGISLSHFEPLDPPPENMTKAEKCVNIIRTIWVFIKSIVVSLTRHLMRYSRDYRYVSRTLSVEKESLKESEGFGMGSRAGKHQIWEPDPEKNLITATSSKEEDVPDDHHLLVPSSVEMGRKLSDISVPEIRILAPSMERGLDATPPPAAVTSSQPPCEPTPSPPPPPSDDDGTSEHESMFSLQTSSSKDVSTLEHDDSMFKHDRSPFVHLMYALWYAILAHTDIVCYIMVFINQIQSATILSIPLPLMVFTWGTLTIPRPTKTFWVTLIAYTEVIVLIKSMFQFEILPWNQKAIPESSPFTAPRIIGIERKSNYALYDLLLLLIIFFHRFMLKSLGLWKESLTVMAVREDGQYPVTGADATRIARGAGADLAKEIMARHEATAASVAMAVEESEPGPSKPSDDHYKVNDDKEPIIEVTTTLEDLNEHYPSVLCLSLKRYLRPMREFFRRMVSPGARVNTDVYAYMFLCDFLNFLIVLFGFAAFGTHQGDGGVQAYLEDNKVPISFLIMLILQFALIVTDRALYLRKFIFGKIVFQYGIIVGVHIWMFFALPFITERTFNALLPPPLWYMVRCVYLLLSAHQIRAGYPRRIIGNFLCKSYSVLNMILFRCFMAIPFLFELRTLMDWIWTDTSMTLMDWLKMEDIFANVFLLKCSRNMEDEYPLERGAKKSTWSKYLLGGSVLAFVIAIIWFPLVFFAVGNTVGIPNPPTDVTVKIRIGPYLPVYLMTAQAHNIEKYTEVDYSELSSLYLHDRTAQTFLSNYMHNDVAAIMISTNSTSTWDISPPEMKRMEEDVKSNSTILVRFTYVVTHLTNDVRNPPNIEASHDAQIKDTDVEVRKLLTDMLEHKAAEDSWLVIKKIFPKFVSIFNKGLARPTDQLLEAGPLRDLEMRLEFDGPFKYWRVREHCDKGMDQELISIPLNDCSKMVMFTFNDKLFPETLNFISGGGIISLYTTFVFLASRVLRGFFSGIYTRIMFDDLPYADRVLQLCLDIYLVREALELTLEEDLFAKLVFLYRSPETMIKWSRPREPDHAAAPPPPPPALQR